MGLTSEDPAPASRSGLCRLTHHNVNEVKVAQKLSEGCDENPGEICRHGN